jgi:hypothetical protein
MIARLPSVASNGLLHTEPGGHAGDERDQIFMGGSVTENKVEGVARQGPTCYL